MTTDAPRTRIASRVLIIEDDEKISRILQATLEKAGYTVKIGITGYALGLLATQFKPDVIFLDIMLPGINGVDALNMLRNDEATAGIKVIGMSASSDQNLINGLIEAGAADFMPKPFKLSDVIPRIEKQIGPIRNDPDGYENNKVLILSDSEENRRAWTHALDAAGYVIETSESLSEAGFAVGTFEPDLILIDFQKEAVETISEHLKELDHQPQMMVVSEMPRNGPTFDPGRDPSELPAAVEKHLGPIRKIAAPVETGQGDNRSALMVFVIVLILVLAGLLIAALSGGNPQGTPNPQVEDPRSQRDQLIRDWKKDEIRRIGSALKFWKGSWYSRDLLGRGEQITLTGGETLHGLVTEDNGTLTVRTLTETRTVSAGDISKRATLQHPYETYWQRSAKTSPTDADGLKELGDWCRNLGLKQAAEREYQRALIANPSLEDAWKALGK
jgi:DNA-binding response OmpR family regulator